MNTQFDYCYTLVPPSGNSTNLVWETVRPNTTVDITIQEVCSPYAGCETGVIGDHVIYDETSSFGTAQFSSPAGLAFTVTASTPLPCGSSSAGPSCGNVSVLISGSWG
jgi:hypothetical protein